MEDRLVTDLKDMQQKVSIVSQQIEQKKQEVLILQTQRAQLVGAIQYIKLLQNGSKPVEEDGVN